MSAYEMLKMRFNYEEMTEAQLAEKATFGLLVKPTSDPWFYAYFEADGDLLFTEPY